MKKHIITVTGLPGSGKSSTAKVLANKLGYEHFSSGDLFRKMAADRGVTVEQLNFLAEKQKEIDDAVDQLLQKIGKEQDHLVVDSRTAYHWIPNSFKVFLDLDPRTAAERTFAQIQKEGRTSQAGASIEEVQKNTFKRVRSEQERYRSLYGIDVTDKTQFDLVVDTAANSLEQVIESIIAAFQKWLNIPEEENEPR
jgi:cytidylate kinase